MNNKIISLESKKYELRLDNFEGPLDLLCYLIDKNKMNIYDVNLNDITEQYIQYLDAMEEMNLEIASEFIVMATTLLYLKSKKLLPKQEEEEEITEEEIDLFLANINNVSFNNKYANLLIEAIITGDFKENSIFYAKIFNHFKHFTYREN